MDFSTEEGRSASVGEGLGFGFGFETDGGDFAKKLKIELCFAMFASFSAVLTELYRECYKQCPGPPCIT